MTVDGKLICIPYEIMGLWDVLHYKVVTVKL